MGLEIPREIEKKLPPRVRTDLAKLDAKKQQMFVDQYKMKARNKAVMVVLAILFPIQLFFLGKVGLGVAFIVTWGGVGIWYFIEWFLTPGRVDTYNANVAEEILADVKLS